MILDTVREALAELGIAPEDISESTRIKGDLELDSTESVVISLEIKKRYGVDIGFEAKTDTTVGEIVSRVEKALAARAAS